MMFLLKLLAFPVNSAEKRLIQKRGIYAIIQRFSLQKSIS